MVSTRWRTELLGLCIKATKSSVAVAIICDGLFEELGGEVGPKDRGRPILAIGGFPNQKV